MPNVLTKPTSNLFHWSILPNSLRSCRELWCCITVDNNPILFLSVQLGQGVLVQVSPSLVKRQKTHFHNLPCGASIILGNNGFIWLYPTPGQQDEEAGGYYTSTEVRALAFSIS